MELSQADAILRILLSLLIGGILGIERGTKSRPAGLRTYILVCVGSCLVMMTNIYVFVNYHASDPVRMGAQVISGIGFLGAGTIMLTGHNHIRGITTAAGLWTSACCGLAIGTGFYCGAIVGAIAVFAVMSVMQKFDRFIHQRARYIEVYVELCEGDNFSDFFEYLKRHQFDVYDVQFIKKKGKEIKLCATISLKSLIRRSHGEMMAMIRGYTPLQYLEEIGIY